MPLNGINPVLCKKNPLYVAIPVRNNRLEINIVGGMIQNNRIIEYFVTLLGEGHNQSENKKLSIHKYTKKLQTLSSPLKKSRMFYDLSLPAGTADLR